jgi:hypothetical protein
MTHCAQVMPSTHTSGESSNESSEEGRIAVRAVPPPPTLQPPVQCGKAKPVTLAEIKARLARKASLEAKKRLDEQGQSVVLPLVEEQTPHIAVSVTPTAPVKPVVSELSGLLLG